MTLTPTTPSPKSMPTFSWPPSNNKWCFIHPTTFYHSSGYASSTTFSCFGPTRPPPSQPSSNTSTHSTSQSNSATSNLTLPSTSWTPQSYPLNNGHYSPHSTSNPPTKDYYSTTQGIIYSQALRYRRIITDNHDLRLHLQRLHKILLARGYSYSTITTAINKTTSHTQSHLLQHKPPPSTTGLHIQFLIPYNTDSKEQNRIMD